MHWSKPSRVHSAKTQVLTQQISNHQRKFIALTMPLLHCRMAKKMWGMDVMPTSFYRRGKCFQGIIWHIQSHHPLREDQIIVSTLPLSPGLQADGRRGGHLPIVDRISAHYTQGFLRWAVPGGWSSVPQQQQLILKGTEGHLCPLGGDGAGGSPGALGHHKI